MKTEEQQIARLTEEQFKVLDMLGRNRRLAIGGCAGSGKTFLAIEKAKRLALAGHRTLLTCFNRSLAEFLKEFVTPMKNLEIENWHGLCRKSSKAAGVQLPAYSRQADNSGLDEMYSQSLLRAMDSMRELRYDAIIVDEAQDFEAEWWPTLENCLRSELSILYLFFDDHQTLYRGRGILPPGLTEVHLNENVRNTQAIFRALNLFYDTADGAPVICRGPAGKPIEQHIYSSEALMRQQISTVVNRLIFEEKIHPIDIVVITPKKLEKSALLSEQLPGQIQLVSHSTFIRKNQVACSTIHSFKGLEKKVVLVAELDSDFMRLPSEEKKSLCYVAFSRAKLHLVVFAQDAVLEMLAEYLTQSQIS